MATEKIITKADLEAAIRGQLETLDIETIEGGDVGYATAMILAAVLRHVNRKNKGQKEDRIPAGILNTIRETADHRRNPISGLSVTRYPVLHRAVVALLAQ